MYNKINLESLVLYPTYYFTLICKRTQLESIINPHAISVLRGVSECNTKRFVQLLWMIFKTYCLYMHRNKTTPMKTSTWLSCHAQTVTISLHMKSLKIQKGYSETIYTRIHNTMAIRKRTKVQTMIYMRPVVSVSALTWFIRYIYHWNLQFLNM